MFFFRDKGEFVIILVYIDDILVTGNNSNKKQKFIQKLNAMLSLKDLLGNLHFFLGIEVFRDESGFYLNQSKFTVDFSTPTVVGKNLSIHDGEPLTNPTVYKSVIGGLKYLASSRLNVCYVVNKLS